MRVNTEFFCLCSWGLFDAPKKGNKSSCTHSRISQNIFSLLSDDTLDSAVMNRDNFRPALKHSQTLFSYTQKHCDSCCAYSVIKHHNFTYNLFSLPVQSQAGLITCLFGSLWSRIGSFCPCLMCVQAPVDKWFASFSPVFVPLCSFSP